MFFHFHPARWGLCFFISTPRGGGYFFHFHPALAGVTFLLTPRDGGYVFSFPTRVLGVIYPVVGTTTQYLAQASGLGCRREERFVHTRRRRIAAE
jgi:hypothetical protein